MLRLTGGQTAGGWRRRPLWTQTVLRRHSTPLLIIHGRCLHTMAITLSVQWPVTLQASGLRSPALYSAADICHYVFLPRDTFTVLSRCQWYTFTSQIEEDRRRATNKEKSFLAVNEQRKVVFSILSDTCAPACSMDRDFRHNEKYSFLYF